MTQTIWFSFLLCIASAKNGSISLLNLDTDDTTWDDCSNEYFSSNFNILDNTNLESILGSSMDVHNSEPENAGRELPGTSAGNFQDSISFDSSHFDFTDLWKSEHRNSEDSKIETVPITTGNSQLQELPRTDDENIHSSVSSDPLHFLDFTFFFTFFLHFLILPLLKNYECPHVGCTMKTKSYKEYIAHRKTHPKPFIYECKVPGCGLTFNHPSSFCSHQETHGPNVQCGNCGKIFNCKNNLRSHKKLCTNVPHVGNYYECPYVGCTMKTKSCKEYIAHRKTHPKPFIYECKVPGCGRTFNHASSFYRHQEAHGPNVQCGNCGKIFNCKNNLRSHEKRCTKAPR
uniref:C2H2-type domain-containing protein n=1 Tax=Wuchereria bancrofti TaxID=6293 RepID=A0AAF5PQT9_WUCBA